MEEPALTITDHPTVVSEEVKKLFNGMTDRESMEFQLSEWVAGRSMHNPVRDECCPDFSCCNPKMLMDEDLRIKFSNAYKMNDKKTIMNVLGMSLSGVIAESGVNACIAGESTTKN